MNSYNFTERVRKVLDLARRAAIARKHEYVGTEHLLIGLIEEGEGIGVAALNSLNIDLDGILRMVDDTIKQGSARPGPDLPYTSRSKKVLELAMAEARDLGHNYVGSEHLLLGLLREEKGIAAQVLADASLTLPALREEIRRLLGGEGTGNGAGATIHVHGAPRVNEKDLFTKFWAKESKTTRNVLARIPEGSDYRPDPKSRTAKEIAWQIVCEEKMIIEALESGNAEWNPPPLPSTMKEVIEAYDSQSATMYDRWTALPADKWTGKISFFGQERPAAPMAWSFLFDIVHHRGQISTYLRPMGSTVPQIYGPSGDEP